MNSRSEFPSPLEGIKVLDFSHVQSGPICTVILADMGADVVNIEPFAGDQFRDPMDGANFFNFGIDGKQNNPYSKTIIPFNAAALTSLFLSSFNIFISSGIIFLSPP